MFAIWAQAALWLDDRPGHTFLFALEVHQDQAVPPTAPRVVCLFVAATIFSQGFSGSPGAGCSFPSDQGASLGRRLMTVWFADQEAGRGYKTAKKPFGNKKAIVQRLTMNGSEILWVCNSFLDTMRALSTSEW